MKVKKQHISKQFELIVRKNLKLKKSSNLSKILKLKIDDDIDSLSLISIFADINQKLKVKFSADQMSSVRSIDDILKIVFQFLKPFENK